MTLNFRAYAALLLVTGTISQASTNGLISKVNTIQNIANEVGFTSDEQRPEQHLLAAYATTFDPKASVLTAEQVRDRDAARRGRINGFGFTFSSTGSSFAVKSYTDDAPAKDVIPSGSTLISFGTNEVENTPYGTLHAQLSHASTHPISVAYRTIRGEELSAEITPGPMQQPSIGLAEDLPSSLGYIRLNGLYPGCAREVISTIRGWSETDQYGFILDLRDAGGTDVSAVQGLASLLASEGSFLFAFRDANDQDLAVFKANAGGPIRSPVMLLINEGTYGAAELLAATLSGNAKGAMLIGRPTQGDPLIRELRPIDEKLSLLIATRKVVTEDGSSFHAGDQVAPHILVSKNASTAIYEPEKNAAKITLDEEIEDRLLRDRVRNDPPLRRAVDLLLGLKALNIQRTVAP